jgi:hypothetical protein
MVATARYLHLKSQELSRRSWRHMRPSATKWKRRSGFEERPQLSMPAPSKSPSSRTKKPWLLPLPMLSARLAEWDTGLLRGQIGLAQQDLARVHNDLTTALVQAHAQVADLGDRLKASVAAERKASARSNQQATSLADLSARLQLDSTMLTMSASVSPYASVSGQRRRSRLCCSRPRAGRLSRLRVCSVPARCMPHLATEASAAQQPQIEGH